MQERRRATAFATALILLAVGWLGARHEAEVSHGRDEAGRAVHAQELADHHELGATAHLHGREVHEHAGACMLLAIAHPPFANAAPPSSVAARQEFIDASGAPCTAASHTTLAAYRLAPKTSPPTHG